MTTAADCPNGIQVTATASAGKPCSPSPWITGTGQAGSGHS